MTAGEQDKDPRFWISAGAEYTTGTCGGDAKAGMFFDYRESSIGNDPRQELSVFLTNRVGADWRVQAFVFRGFTDSGADRGTGLQVKRHLPSLR